MRWELSGRRLETLLALWPCCVEEKRNEVVLSMVGGVGGVVTRSSTEKNLDERLALG